MVVDCIPGTVKLYDYMLSVDVLGVGDCLLSIPILAECIISPLKLGTVPPYPHHLTPPLPPPRPPYVPPRYFITQFPSPPLIISTLAAREIPFGSCFIRYPYEKELTLLNTSDAVHTKFEGQSAMHDAPSHNQLTHTLTSHHLSCTHTHQCCRKCRIPPASPLMRRSPP